MCSIRRPIIIAGIPAPAGKLTSIVERKSPRGVEPGRFLVPMQWLTSRALDTSATPNTLTSRSLLAKIAPSSERIRPMPPPPPDPQLYTQLLASSGAAFTAGL